MGEARVTESVSYTHLDVYKRQTYGFGMKYVNLASLNLNTV